ncbi:hypothetical protein [Streptomyces sp. KL116D]
MGALAGAATALPWTGTVPAVADASGPAPVRAPSPAPAVRP